VYGVDLPMLKPWTSRPNVIDGVLMLVDTATRCANWEKKCLDDMYHQLRYFRFALDPSKANTKSPSKELLPELATVFFACVQERLDWLGRQVVCLSASLRKN